MKKAFVSKIGLEIVIPILVILMIGFHKIVIEPNIRVIILLIFILSLITYTLTQIRYIIEGNTLVIKTGFLVNHKIEISTIKKISKSKSILSAPAASLDRLEIAYQNNQSVLISPKNKKGFIEELKKINPQIELSI